MSKRSSSSRVFSACPETAREQRIEEAAKVVRSAIDAEGTNHAITAAWIGLSITQFKCSLSPTSGRLLSLADTAGLPPAVLRRVVSWLADSLGCAVVDLPESSDEPVSVRMLAEMSRETGAVVADALEAVADGHVTRSEGCQIEGKIDHAVSQLLALRNLARQAQREGVVGVGRMHS